MGKGRKARQRYKKGQVSNGVNSNVVRSTLNAMRRDVTAAQKYENIWKAYLAGRDPWITLDMGEGLRERFKKVKMRDIHGDPREWRKKRGGGIAVDKKQKFALPA